MDKLKDYKERLFRLIKRDAYHEGEIKLASGKTSNYYIDARAVTLSAEGAFLCAGIVFELVKDKNIKAVGGPTLGADPIVGALASFSFQNNKPINTFLIRKTPKSHGRMLQVEGPELKPGEEVVLIDDVATTGGSIVDAISILKGMQVKVREAIVLVDRQDGAAETLSKHGCSLISIFKASEFSTRNK